MLDFWLISCRRVLPIVVEKGLICLVQTIPDLCTCAECEDSTGLPGRPESVVCQMRLISAVVNLPRQMRGIHFNENIAIPW